jgi:hypothetical protein
LELLGLARLTCVFADAHNAKVPYPGAQRPPFRVQRSYA